MQRRVPLRDIGLRSLWRPGDPVSAALIPERIDDPPPGGIALTMTARCPMAHDVFTPDELEERLQAISDRIDLENTNQPATTIECMACGKSAPNNLVGRDAGWAVRRLVTPGFGAISETYCPECYARWGWDW